MLKIHSVCPQDLPALHQMIVQLCAFHGDTCQMRPDDMAASFIDGPLVSFVAKNAGAYVGYAVLARHWRPTETGDLLEIAHLYVAPPFRAHGIGKALIANAAQFARVNGACKLVIGTSPANPTAAAIYRGMGFAEITAQPGPRFEVPMG